MTELERALVALGRELDFPAEPDLVPGVRARIARRRSWVRPLAFAAALLVVGFGIAMAVPEARSAILRFFHIGVVTVERVEALPAAEERPLAAGLGPPLSRAQAEARSGIRIELPDFEGSPPQRYYARPGLIAALFQFDSKPILLAEITGDQVGIVKKLAGPETEVEPAQIGAFGLWIEGGRHVLTWEFEPGKTRRVATRLAGNVLIWLRNDRTYRLEGDLHKGQMLELARQITR
jgi:hypothetical protein